KMYEEKIAPQLDFDLRAYWQEARRNLEEQEQPLNMVLRVLPTARSSLRGDYDVLREERDHGVIVQVKIESLDEAVSYALSLGTNAEVISPRKVREAVSTAARAIAETYGTK
ncbi:MAG: WYL domain-containing protein, partial [Chloroflexi bacterium]